MISVQVEISIPVICLNLEGLREAQLSSPFWKNIAKRKSAREFKDDLCRRMLFTLLKDNDVRCR